MVTGEKLNLQYLQTSATFNKTNNMPYYIFDTIWWYGIFKNFTIDFHIYDIKKIIERWEDKKHWMIRFIEQLAEPII